VTGTTQSGCTAKDTIQVYILPKPAIVLSKDTIICPNTTIQLSASGGISYSWSPASTLSNSSISNPLASPTISTTYFLTTVGANSCTSKDSVIVSIWSAPNFNISSSDTICINDSIQLDASGGYKYLWQPTTAFSNANIPNPKVSPQTTSTYTVLASDNCGNSQTLSTTITVQSLPIVQITQSNDIDCITSQAQLTASGGVKFHWTPSTNISSIDLFNPTIYPKSDTWYGVTVTGSNGCVTKDSIFISTSFASGSGNFYIPNAFTPNNDGKNDCFSLKHWGQTDEFEMLIFNRWGEVVFKSTNTTNCWNGIFRGQLQPAGVYIYQMRVRSVCTNGVLHKTGHIILIR
jgi:gliding motility-associated-like protein